VRDVEATNTTTLYGGYRRGIGGIGVLPLP
jgi:hypothetical protein